MNSVNFNLGFILPRLFYGSLISLVIGVLMGGLIGLLIGVLKQSLKTILPAMMGSYLGIMLLAMLPLFSYQKAIADDPYEAAMRELDLMALLLPLGSIVGGVVGSICGLKLRPRLQRWASLMGLVFTYTVMVIVLYSRQR